VSGGPDAINRQLDTYKAAIERSGAEVEEAFVAPGWNIERWRWPGFVLQIDEPGLRDWWNMLKPEPTVEAHRQFARLRIVGRENVIARTDCALGGRVYPDLAWAELRSLVEGTRLASTSLRP
jgi:hypothetical protein